MWNKEELWEQLADNECLLADGFNEAVIGITFGVNATAVYSVSKILDILVEEGMSMEDAIEHFEYNIGGGYMGEKTPIWVYDLDEQE